MPGEVDFLQEALRAIREDPGYQESYDETERRIRAALTGGEHMGDVMFAQPGQYGYGYGGGGGYASMQGMTGPAAQISGMMQGMAGQGAPRAKLMTMTLRQDGVTGQVEVVDQFRGRPYLTARDFSSFKKVLRLRGRLNRLLPRRSRRKRGGKR